MLFSVSINFTMTFRYSNGIILYDCSYPPQTPRLGKTRIIPKYVQKIEHLTKKKKLLRRYNNFEESVVYLRILVSLFQLSYLLIFSPFDHNLLSLMEIPQEY